MKKIKCKNHSAEEVKRVRVRILKAPFVDSKILNQIVSERSRAVVI